MTGLLKDKIALVTGASEGIGFATAKRFAKEGVTAVFITGRREDELEKAASEIGNKAVAIRSDSSKASDLDHLFRVIQYKAGKLDLLFVNAGVGPLTPLDSVSEDAIDSIYSINLRGVVLTVQKALKLLVDNAAIVLNASIAGTIGTPGASIYGSSKAAVIQLTKSWSAELSSKHIRVNSVSPGAIDTDMTKATTAANEEVTKWFISRVSLKRIGQPEEVASAVTFLLSPEASYISGVDLRVDGGFA